MGVKKFLDLCSRGTPERVESEINNGADVNMGKNNGYTPLIVAAAYNPNQRSI